MSIDIRDARIVLQNALGHATKIMIHNSKGETVDVDEVIKMAKHIAKEVLKIGHVKE